MTLDTLLTPSEIARLNRTIEHHNVTFLTARKSSRVGLSATRQAQLWLEGLGIDAHAATVLATEDRYRKADIAPVLGIDVAIDDNPKQLRELHEVGIKTVARAWQYNGEWRPRVQSLGEFLDLYV